MAGFFFHGCAFNTSGDLPEVGVKAPEFLLTDSKLQDVSLRDYAGKKILLCIVSSLDTPTCAATARNFNLKALRMNNTAVLVISADLPFAQCRFCENEGLEHIIPLSTMRSNFAGDYGVKIIDGPLSGLAARAVIVLDESHTVVYTQLVREITEEPDYQSALAALITAFGRIDE